MKRIVSISLSIFLVMGAMVLLSGGTQANAEEVSSAWAGQFACNSKVSYHPSPSATKDAATGLEHLDIGSDGTVVANFLFVEHGTWGARFSELQKETGTATEGPFSSLQVEFTSPYITSTAFYIGEAKGPFGRFLSMRYIAVGVPVDPSNPVHRMEGRCVRILTLPVWPIE